MFYRSEDRTEIDRHLVTLFDPTSFEAEQYGRLRQRIELGRTDAALRVIAVTSAVVSDGKTLTAINLAGALAKRKDRRVLLIDADLRCPSVAKKLGFNCLDQGLTAALQTTHGTISSFVQPVEGTTLSVLPSGTPSADTYELLTSPRLGEIIAEARALYDYVVVDTPPIIPVPDSGLIRNMVDGYIVVVSARSTPRKLFGEALSLLDPNSVIGLVFNRDERPLFGYRRSYYGQYFKSYVRSVNGR